MIAAAAAAPLLALTLLVSPTAVATSCEVETATLSWGFKESFRSYISGTIANGEWSVADGATYETPDFGWSSSTGSYGRPANRIQFEGSVRFTGHDGILDTTIANPRIEWSRESGTLYLDVVGTTQEGAPIDERGVEFATITVPSETREDGGISIVDATATLTDAGAAAFGTYQAGETLDPLSFDFTVEEGCALLASDPAPGGSPWIVWTLVGIAAIGIAGVAVAAVPLIRRRLGD